MTMTTDEILEAIKQLLPENTPLAYLSKERFGGERFYTH